MAEGRHRSPRVVSLSPLRRRRASSDTSLPEAEAFRTPRSAAVRNGAVPGYPDSDPEWPDGPTRRSSSSHCAREHEARPKGDRRDRVEFASRCNWTSPRRLRSRNPAGGLVQPQQPDGRRQKHQLLPTRNSLRQPPPRPKPTQQNHLRGGEKAHSNHRHQIKRAGHHQRGVHKPTQTATSPSRPQGPAAFVWPSNANGRKRFLRYLRDQANHNHRAIVRREADRSEALPPSE